MADFLQGVLGTQQAGVEARNDLTVAIKNFYANRNPLATRLAYVDAPSTTYQMFTHPYRKQATTLGAAVTSTGQTTLTVADASMLQNHDVLELVDSNTGNREYIQINGDPTSGTTANMTRGVAVLSSGTLTLPSAGNYATGLSAVANGSTVNIIGNSRTGAEVLQTALTTLGTPRTNWTQTFQHAVQIGGAAQSATAQVMPGGIASPYDWNRTMQLQNMVDGIEKTLYFGIGQAPTDSAGITAKTSGVRSILTTNNISAYTNSTPVNAAAYGPSDLVRDLLYSARNGGGSPDLLVVSTNFMVGFTQWGLAVQRIPAGETIFGTPIETMECPFLNGVSIVEAPLLPAYTAMCFTSAEIYIKAKRYPFWNQRGNRGDMLEGEWIAELGLEICNESHHSYVEGITAFAAN